MPHLSKAYLKLLIEQFNDYKRGWFEALNGKSFVFSAVFIKKEIRYLGA